MYTMPQWVLLLIVVPIAAGILRLLPLSQDLPQLAVTSKHLHAETQIKNYHKTFAFTKHTKRSYIKY